MVKGFMAAILTVATLAGALMLLDTPTVSADEHKVEICHRRNAVNNAYGPKKIEIAKQAIFKQGQDTHTGPVATSAVVAQQLKGFQIRHGVERSPVARLSPPRPIRRQSGSSFGE